ncbi:MAG: hypothetical protein GXX96_08745 [Planctomycetaceae bacterium]|nr:hypothetical protein [Planctomycetaceae bacterium]
MKRTISWLLGAAVVLGCVLACFSAGCKPQGKPGDSQNAASENVLWRNELFGYAIDSLLMRMDEFYKPERRQETINRLDQWVRIQNPLDDWQPDPVIASVPNELRGVVDELAGLAERIEKLQQGADAGPVETLPGEFRSAGERLQAVGERLALGDVIQRASQLVATAEQLKEMIGQNAAKSPDEVIGALRNAFSQFKVEEFRHLNNEYSVFAQRIDPSILEFPEFDSRAFQEAVWLRNLATWAKGDELDDPVKPAMALFDWVVKNVDLVRESPPENGQNPTIRVLQTPVETLLFGKGTGIDRAWLFVLLARQLDIDAALLELTDEEGGASRLWGVGVLIEGEIYLFEPVLGLPVPKPGSMELTESGFTLRPATLSEAAEDEAVLRQLDIFKQGDYGIHAKDMQRVSALVEASPSYLSQRMRMVEKRLAGDQKLVLTTDATAQIERFKKCRHIVDGRMWSVPYWTLWQEVRLGLAREQWREARLKPFVFPPGLALLWRGRSCHFEGQFTGNPSATMYYQQARQSDFTMDSAAISAEDRQQWREIKINASYWLGLIAAQGGNYRAAEDYLMTRVLEIDPIGAWEYGATYNLARVAEAMGKASEAVKFYRMHSAAPQLQGNLIRARWLMKLTGQPVPDLQPATDKEKEGAEAKPPANDEKPVVAPESKPDATKPPSESNDAEADRKKSEKDSEPPVAEKQAPADEKEKPEAKAETG